MPWIDASTGVRLELAATAKAGAMPLADCRASYLANWPFSGQVSAELAISTRNQQHGCRFRVDLAKRPAVMRLSARVVHSAVRGYLSNPQPGVRWHHPDLLLVPAPRRAELAQDALRAVDRPTGASIIQAITYPKATQGGRACS